MLTCLFLFKPTAHSWLEEENLFLIESYLNSLKSGVCNYDMVEDQFKTKFANIALPRKIIRDQLSNLKKHPRYINLFNAQGILNFVSII
jgi:hypothetical protein